MRKNISREEIKFFDWLKATGIHADVEHWNITSNGQTFYEDGKALSTQPVRLYNIVIKDEYFISLCKLVFGVTRLTVDKLWSLYQLSKIAKEGCVIEVGTYRGGSAKFLAELYACSDLFFYDTFDGIPDITSDYDKPIMKNSFQYTDYESVIKYIGHKDRVSCVEGFFPNSFIFPEEEISFVYLDVDTYSCVIDSLNLLYPLLTQGAIVLIDDYDLNYKGVRIAVNEYMQDKSESLLQFVSDQVFFIKNNRERKLKDGTSNNTTE